MRTKAKKKGFLDGYKTYDTSEGFGGPSEWKSAFKARMTPEEADKILQNENPLDILSLKSGATLSQIKQAYRAACMKWHPDRNKDVGAETMFKKCHAAYIKLKASFE